MDEQAESFLRNVWNDNFYQEIVTIRRLIKKYKYVSMDTEFPGVVAKPIGNFKTANGFAYQQLRCNVDILNLIQFGMTLSDEHGNRPEPVNTWQFNMAFDLDQNMHSKEAIDLLKAANIDFDEHKNKGIDLNEFGLMLFTSGLVLCSDIHWIGFHCAYDFAYLIKLLTGNSMPEKEMVFYDYLNALFPSFIDFKYLIQDSEHMKKGLQEISGTFGCVRQGTAHQAGSDALLTSAVFFKASAGIFTKEFINENRNKLYGIELY
ncbi:mRNA deadenylase subunit [Enterospora canceri]|uniref:poly(A)-specific ribonuclease n=1 Tax=Enterospora canceri TaxID=1081671 RepID=A0A1Y1S9I1_9MICR|nr:mRNA deadenylase subunit [Enterospora canceri]